MGDIKDQGIFIRQKINFRPPGTISNLVAAKETLVLGFTNSNLLEIHLKKGDDKIDLSVSINSGDGISDIFIDPTGRHCIVSTLVGDNFYRNTGSTSPKLKPLTKFKGYVISSVGWNCEQSTDDTTGFIVIGTSRGTVYEIEINDGAVQYSKMIYELISQVEVQKSGITGLQLRQCPNSRYIILISSASQFVPMIGHVNLGETPALLALCAQNNHRVHSLDSPSDFNGVTCLRLHPPTGQANSFAWLAAAGIRYGMIDCNAVDGFNMIQQEHFFMHPEVNGRPDTPLEMELCEYHLVLLYSDRLVAISTLNQQIVFEDNLGNKLGKLLGMCQDPFTKTIWVFSQSTVLKYKPDDINRYVWKVFADRGDFHKARLSAGKDVTKLNSIIRLQADALFLAKKYVASAELLAMCDCLFEDVCLKLVQCDDPMALRTFIDKKLDQVDQSNKTQQCMLVFWLLELHLTHLNQVTSSGTGSDTFDNTAYKAIRANLECFLHRRQVVECLRDNQNAAYKLVTSHGDNDCLLLLATLLQDWDKVLTLDLQQERYDQALQHLIKLQDPKLLYKFSSELLQFIPAKLVDAWISFDRRISPKRLLPSMFNCHTKQTMSQDSAIHNLLLSLLVRVQPEQLMEYLNEQGTDPKGIFYDIKYALRLCTEHNLKRACVHLYRVLCMHEDAVNLALEIDVKLAEMCVQSLDKNDRWQLNSQELIKKLWLRIARHVVENEKDMVVCMQLLDDSDGALQIQDLLPFFPHFATIDNFKDSLCECLKAHSGKVQKLQKEMKEATALAEDIKNDMNKMSKTYCLVRPRDVCDICGTRVFGTSFYLFPCTHLFHSECLQKEVIKSMDQEQIALLSELNNVQNGFGDNLSVNSVAINNACDQPAKLDQLLASECPWCGQHLIRLVDKPFFTPAEYGQQLATWDIK